MDKGSPVVPRMLLMKLIHVKTIPQHGLHMIDGCIHGSGIHPAPMIKCIHIFAYRQFLPGIGMLDIYKDHIPWLLHGPVHQPKHPLPAPASLLQVPHVGVLFPNPFHHQDPLELNLQGHIRIHGNIVYIIISLLTIRINHLLCLPVPAAVIIIHIQAITMIDLGAMLQHIRHHFRMSAGGNAHCHPVPKPNVFLLLFHNIDPLMGQKIIPCYGRVLSLKPLNLLFQFLRILNSFCILPAILC